MATTTLFKTLTFGDTTFIIEAVSPLQDDTHDVPVRTPDKVRGAMPADPWADTPIALTSAGRVVYGPTVMVRQYQRR